MVFSCRSKELEIFTEFGIEFSVKITGVFVYGECKLEIRQLRSICCVH